MCRRSTEHKHAILLNDNTRVDVIDILHTVRMTKRTDV